MPMFHVFTIFNALFYLQANHKRYDSPWQVGHKTEWSLLQKVELGYVAATCNIEMVAQQVQSEGVTTGDYAFQLAMRQVERKWCPYYLTFTEHAL